MARSGNVISFEDAKRMADSSRPSVKSSSRQRRSQGDSSRGSSARANASSHNASTRSAHASRAPRTGSSFDRTFVDSLQDDLAALDADFAGAFEPNARRESARCASGAGRSAGRDLFVSDIDAASDEPFDFDGGGKRVADGSDSGEAADGDDDVLPSRAEMRKRKRVKEKASRQFMKQFGGESSSAGEGGTRPALYKAEMGREHKRAFSQMGGSAREGASRLASGVSRKAAEPSRSGAPRLFVWAGTLVCVLVVFVFLYPAAQQYYVELRNHDRLQAEYEAIAARNEAIQDEVDYLGTDEGIEDAARTELGWTNEGEQPVVVSGLPEGESAEASDPKVHKQIVAGSVPAPDTWYSGVLDVVFGYDPESQVKI